MLIGMWPLHGLCGTWGVIGDQALGGLGGVRFTAQLIGSAMGVV